MYNFKKILFILSLLALSNCSQNKITHNKNIYLKVADETLALGNSEAALNFYDKALQYDKLCIQAKVGRIEALINMDKLDAALHEINVAKKTHPTCSDLDYSKGKILLLRGNINEAKKIFERLPNHYKALNALGTIYDAQFNSITAQEYYKKAIRLNGQYADAYGNLGLSMVLSGNDINSGISYLERACSMTGSSITQKNNLALAYGIIGDYDKSKAIYEEELTPSEANLKVAQLKRIVMKKNQNKK